MPFEQITPRPFTHGAILNYAPATTGIYGISNAREWIYIGETDDIRQTLLEHLGDQNTSLMKHHPTGFVFEICGTGGRVARQNRLRTEYGPACNGPSSRSAR